MLQCKSACTPSISPPPPTCRPSFVHLFATACFSFLHYPHPPSLHIPFSTPSPKPLAPPQTKICAILVFHLLLCWIVLFIPSNFHVYSCCPSKGSMTNAPKRQKLPLGGGRGTLQLLLPGAGLYGNISGEILWYFSCADQGLSSSLSIWNAFEFEGFPQFDLLHSSWQPKIYKSSAFRTFSIRLILTKLKLIKFHIAHKRWEFN